MAKEHSHFAFPFFSGENRKMLKNRSKTYKEAFHRPMKKNEKLIAKLLFHLQRGVRTGEQTKKHRH